MRLIMAWLQGITALVFLGGLAPASMAAQDSAPPCEKRTGVLGVSRTIEIDTEHGPRYGRMQYHENDILADGEVVLTFDDGPLRRNTEAVLAALEAECTKATFFTVGSMIAAGPDTFAAIARHGHTIGTHTWSHRNLRALSSERAQREIELAVSAASAALGRPVAPFFRFPYLSDSKAVLEYLQKRNIASFSIDIDTKDYATRRPEQVQRRVLAGLEAHKKGIILFHDIQRSTAAALKGVLAELRTRGYKVVHLVPKAPVTTLPKYDAEAAVMLARKKLAAARHPLVNRSLVWPLQDPSLAPPAAPASSPVLLRGQERKQRKVRKLRRSTAIRSKHPASASPTPAL